MKIRPGRNEIYENVVYSENVRFGYHKIMLNCVAQQLDTRVHVSYHVIDMRFHRSYIDSVAYY